MTFGVGTMIQTRRYPDSMLKTLQHPKESDAYLKASLEENDDDRQGTDRHLQPLEPPWNRLVEVEKKTTEGGIPAALLSHAYVAIPLQPLNGYSADGVRAGLEALPVPHARPQQARVSRITLPDAT